MNLVIPRYFIKRLKRLTQHRRPKTDDAVFMAKHLFVSQRIIHICKAAVEAHDSNAISALRKAKVPDYSFSANVECMFEGNGAIDLSEDGLKYICVLDRDDKGRNILHDGLLYTDEAYFIHFMFITIANEKLSDPFLCRKDADIAGLPFEN